MLRDFAFDLKLFAVIPVKAPNASTARKYLKAFMSQEPFETAQNIRLGDTEIANTIMSYVDDEDGPHLFEVDGESVED